VSTLIVAWNGIQLQLYVLYTHKEIDLLKTINHYLKNILVHALLIFLLVKELYKPDAPDRAKKLRIGRNTGKLGKYCVASTVDLQLAVEEESKPLDRFGFVWSRRLEWCELL
jgi:hypothetical protein